MAEGYFKWGMSRDALVTVQPNVETELKTLAEVSLMVVAAMSYARFASSLTRPGSLRLLALSPVLSLLPWLPWRFTFLQLRGPVAFFLVWLAPFKLLLLSFGSGPLSPSDPFLHFLLSAALPVKLKTENTSKTQRRRRFLLLLRSAVFALLVAALVPVYRFKDAVHRHVLLLVYCVHIYLGLELNLGVSAVAAELLLPSDLELEPQVDEPYRAASLREFWGRRWNLMVPAILRPSVYHPVRARLGAAAGVLAAFLVSGLMHEVLFYYCVLAPPKGEVTAFFVLHGLCVLGEEAALRRGWWRPPAALAVPATLGFVLATSSWLFFPPLAANGVGAEAVLAEHAAAMDFVRRTWRASLGRVGLD